ncbi:MAG: D-2-hydroxyacid dehydrogenase [Verrucomicrobiota bacterium]|jgi:glycerate dehydrogenase
MKIVVLDGYTLNPGDLSWSELESLGPCEIHERTPPDEIIPRASEAGILLTNKVPITREHLEQLPQLRYIGVLATGFNIVDTAAARQKQIPVTNVPAYGTKSVAQMTLALLLELALHVGHHAQTVREGRWSRSADWCYWDHPLIELEGLTLGVVGLGRIGQAVAELAHAFGMKVLAFNPTPKARPYFVELTSLDDLFRKSDVVSLHCPLNPQTRHLVNAERLARMKPTAFLINTSRGPLVDEPALAEALRSGTIAGAALDVLGSEPPPLDHPLFDAPNCLITPHIAWATRAARLRLMHAAVANVRAFLQGHPQNVVN